MKTSNYFAYVAMLIAMLFINLDINAQLDTPRGSQMASVSQTVGISKVYINYSRPSVNDREIWGQLVPYGMNNLGFGTAKESPWRAGANENTIIKFTSDANVEGQIISAGKYGLHMIIHDGAEKATIILSKNNSAWGSYFYEPSEDVLRVDVVMRDAAHAEQLTYAFENVTANSATAVLSWGKKQVPFKVEMNVTDIVLTDIRSKLQTSPGFGRQTWEQAANFSLNNGGDLNEALGWIDNAIAGQFYSQKTFNNVSIKAQILNKLGKTDDYVVLMDEAASMANMAQLNVIGYQMMTAKDYKRALKYFKQNVVNNPTNANVHDSLGECYKTMGDKKNAIKSLKKSLSLNPAANVRANSEKLLGELGAL